MPKRALTIAIVTLISAFGLVLGACGGDDGPRRADVTWRPNDRLPITAEHWWWDPAERECEEDTDCRSGEQCELVRLGTCRGCPRGEDNRICVPDDWDGIHPERAAR